MVEALEHAHPTPGTGQIAGGDESVVPASDDDDVDLRIDDQPR